MDQNLNQLILQKLHFQLGQLTFELCARDARIEVLEAELNALKSKTEEKKSDRDY